MGVHKHQVLAVLAACALVAAAVFCHRAWVHHRSMAGEILRCERQRTVLKARQEQIEEQRRAWLRVQRFLERARELGLEPSRWDRYEVVIDEPVSFQVAGEILEQAVSGPAYVFQPRSLEIVKGGAKTPPRAQAPKGSALSGDSPQKEGDLTVALRGAFLVRQR